MFKSNKEQLRRSKIFDLSFVTTGYVVRFSVYIVGPSVLSLNNLKLHLEPIWSTFNPGLLLTRIWGWSMVTSCWSADTLFQQVSIDHNMTPNIKNIPCKPRLHDLVLAGICCMLCDVIIDYPQGPILERWPSVEVQLCCCIKYCCIIYTGNLTKNTVILKDISNVWSGSVTPGRMLWRVYRYLGNNMIFIIYNMIR